MHPSYKFLRSFTGTSGQLRGWSSDEESDEAALREAKLHGYPWPLPESKPGGPINWEVAMAWEEELRDACLKCPREIQGIDKVADVDMVLEAILPWGVSNANIIRLQTEETLVQCRNESEKRLDKLLGHLGF